ncbi:MAG TPA: accessory gene regulator B family protein [Candidatus Onthousia faecipullorum]|uniref:Accessory gene regulator B family protein n=1 Tax=Candidatus Onthousia faecipullorum TaxID=2840887 RepID=A0A9D1GA40_9FIRM|nr:accessory gene regulator B family protein [Candidatus Onthousia faecipullorum]
MKEAFLNHTMNFIASNQKNLSEEDREKLSYGLEGLYMNVTKLALIFLIAFLLGFLKEFIIALILFNLLRFPGFGFHASKSIVCLITSTILILGIPYLFTNIEVSLTIKIILCIVSIITFIICAPADTWKRPLTNKKKRLLRKVSACSLAIIYSVMVIIFDGNMISNLLLSALLTETILISPIMYLIFKEPYRNYKKV